MHRNRPYGQSRLNWLKWTGMDRSALHGLKYYMDMAQQERSNYKCYASSLILGIYLSLIIFVSQESCTLTSIFWYFNENVLRSNFSYPNYWIKKKKGIMEGWREQCSGTYDECNHLFLILGKKWITIKLVLKIV